MALWIDRPVWAAHDTLFSHLVSDGGLEESGAASWGGAAQELREALAAAGLHPGWLDGDHADVPAESFEELLGLGARLRSAREITSMLEATGQRLRKGRQGRCLVRRVHSEQERTDLVRSSRVPDAGSTVRQQQVVTDGDRVLLAETSDGWDLPAAPAHPARPIGFLERATRREGRVQRAHVAYSLTLVDRGVGPSRGSAPIEGRWVPVPEAAQQCGHALWWPLVARGFERGWGA